MSSVDVPFLVSQYRAVEVLDALTERPHTLRELQSAIGAARRPLARTLRVLAAHGTVRRTSSGSWDRLNRTAARYDLTGTGRQLAAELSRLDVWTELYEHYL